MNTVTISVLSMKKTCGYLLLAFEGQEHGNFIVLSGIN